PPSLVSIDWPGGLSWIHRDAVTNAVGPRIPARSRHTSRTHRRPSRGRHISAVVRSLAPRGEPPTPNARGRPGRKTTLTSVLPGGSESGLDADHVRPPSAVR